MDRSNVHFFKTVRSAIKRKILGENMARLYGIDLAAQKAKLSQDSISGKLAARV
jgi:hypothetical protein